MTDKAFKCRICGERFDLPKDEMILYNEGYYHYDPEICEECDDIYDDHPEPDYYSDSDQCL